MGSKKEDLLELCNYNDFNIIGYDELVDTVIKKNKDKEVSELFEILCEEKKVVIAKKVIPFLPKTITDNCSGKDLIEEALYFYGRHADLFD